MASEEQNDKNNRDTDLFGQLSGYSPFIQPQNQKQNPVDPATPAAPLWPGQAPAAPAPGQAAPELLMPQWPGQSQTTAPNQSQQPEWLGSPHQWQGAPTAGYQSQSQPQQEPQIKVQLPQEQQFDQLKYQYQQQLQQQPQSQQPPQQPLWPGQNPAVQQPNQPAVQQPGTGQSYAGSSPAQAQPPTQTQPPTQAQPPAPQPGGQADSSEFIPQTPRYMNPPSYPDLPWKAGPGPTWAIFADHEHHRNPPQPPAPKPAVPPGGSAANPLPVLPLPIGGLPEVDDEEAEHGQNDPIKGSPAAQSAPLEVSPAGQIPRRRPLGPAPQPEESEPSSFISRRPFLSSGSSKPSSLGLSFSKSDIFGLASYNFIVIRDILFDPRIFFNELQLNGGFGEPILFCIFACLLSSTLYAIAHLNILLFFWSFIVSFLSVTLGAVVVTWAFRKMGGKGNLEGTFRVLAFGKATVVFSWISMGAVPLGILLATAYTGYMNYVGLRRVHQLKRKQTIILVVVLSILGMLWRRDMP